MGQLCSRSLVKLVLITLRPQLRDQRLQKSFLEVFFFCHCDVELPGLCRRTELAMWVRPLCLNPFLRAEPNRAGAFRLPPAAFCPRLCLGQGNRPKGWTVPDLISGFLSLFPFSLGFFPLLLCKSLWQLNNRDPELKIMRSTNSLSSNSGC